MHAMKIYGKVEEQRHSFLAMALDGSRWSTLRPGCFTPGENAYSTHWIGGSVGSRDSLDVLDTHWKGVYSFLLREGFTEW
jgi:hypothetical protein